MCIKAVCPAAQRRASRMLWHARSWLRGVLTAMEGRVLGQLIVATMGSGNRAQSSDKLSMCREPAARLAGGDRDVGGPGRAPAGQLVVANWVEEQGAGQ